MLKDIVNLLESEINPEPTIRNRVEALVKNNELKKDSEGNEVFVSSASEIVFPEKDLKINSESLEKYLKWRFPTREGSSGPTIQKFADDITSIGKETIDQLDDTVRKCVNKLRRYEKKYYLPERKLNQIGALRICTGLSEPKLGKNGTTNFYISDFDEFAGPEG